MKIQHLIPIFFLAAFCTVSAQTNTPATNGVIREALANPLANAKLATRVVAEKQTVRLGDPIIVSLSVSNQTQQVQQMGGGTSGNGDFEITDPDGKTLPSLGFFRQTWLGGRAVQPGSTVTIFATENLTEDYLFQKTGRYSIWFSGGYRLSNSPAITIEVTAGRLSEMDEIVATVLPVCPEGWYLAKRARVVNTPVGSGFAVQLYKNRWQGEAVDLWLTKERAKVDSNPQPGLKIQYLGQTRGRFVYGSVGSNAPALWPTAVEDISHALQITKQ